MKIIKVSAIHSDLLASMHAKSFDKALSKEDFDTFFQNKFNQVLMVAEEKEEGATPLGFVLFQQVEKDCEIITICTLPEYRRLGVAKTLIGAIDANKLFLEVDENNLAAVNLYESLGFQIENVREKYYNNGHNALVMSLYPRKLPE